MERRDALKHAAAIVATALIVLAIYVLNPASFLKDRLGDFGYAGVFLIMLVSSATVFLPVPGFLVIPALGAAYNPFLVGIAGGLGSAIGELSGYLFGFGGQSLLDKHNAWHTKLTVWMTQKGFLTILALSFVPNPFFDIAGVVAGASGYPWWKFFFACLIGKTARCILFAYLGKALIP